MTDETLHTIGGGIAGLSLALGLLRAGRKLRVFDFAPTLGEVGAGLSISPNAALGLEDLGLLDFMEAEFNQPQANYVRPWEPIEDRVCIDRTTDVDRFGAKFYQIHLANFHAELLSRIEVIDQNCFFQSHSLADIFQDGDSVQMTFENRRVIKSVAANGADRIRSVTRERSFAREPLETLLKGRVALIDDGAHSMLLWLGQGASSSIEDAVVLARCLLEDTTLSVAFEAFHQVHHDRVRFLQKESNLSAERMQGFDPYVLRDAPRRDEDASGIFNYSPATVERA